MPVTGNEFLLDLNVHDTLSLLIEPTYNYPNAAFNSLGVFKNYFGKDKMRMLHMSMSDNVLQPATNCETWHPTIRSGLRPDEITVCDYELMGEQCDDEFRMACTRNFLGDMPMQVPQQSATLNALESALVTLLQRKLRNSIFKINWFGDRNFPGSLDLSHLSNIDRKNLENMLSLCDGWWTELIARTTTSNIEQRVAYVDTNDGTQDGNAMNPANITAFLDQMRISSDLALGAWNDEVEDEGRALYLLQPGLFRALRKYYQSIDTEMANQFIINGEPQRGVLMYDGDYVIEVRAWDAFDRETNNIIASGQWAKESLTQRALYVAPGTLTTLANTRNLEGFPETGLIVATAPDIRSKGKKLMYTRLGIGTGIASPKLVTVGYNSSTTFTAPNS